MANDKKPNAIYEPGELSRVRDKLGKFDPTEARRMAQLLGGEVGTEKNIDKQPAGKGSSHLRRKTVEMAVPGRQGKQPGRLVEVAGGDEDNFGSGFFSSKPPSNDPSDNPSILLKTSYRERVKMDRYAAQFEFEIKNSFQVFTSIFSFVNDPSDYVNPRFVSRRMNAYYSKIEQLVTATRSLFPRNNARRSERLKKSSPFVFSILDTLRYWDIERIGGDLAKIQAHPRSARVSEFADILRFIYRPMFILEKLNPDIHIKGAFKLLYKLLLLENTTDTKEKNQELIRIALASFADIRREVHYGLYPLLIKFISDRWFPYEKLFTARQRRFMAFIGATESEQIQSLTLSPEQVEGGDLETLRENIQKEEAEAAGETVEEEEDPNDPQVIERKAREAAAAAEQKALGHSIGALNTLFPKAGWEKLAEFPDLYPYFAKPYGLRHGYELIAPTDPLQQIAILMHIIESICAGLHSVLFGHIIGPDGNPVHVGGAIGDIITNWQRYIDESFGKEYLPRLLEYCGMLEQHSTDAKNSVFAKRTMNDLRWTKRLYFLPYYKFTALGPPPFKDHDTIAIYTQTRTMRKYLTMVAAGIEQGNRRGGAGAKAPCNGIDNPWAQYHFEVPNPVSRRLDALLPPVKRNNAVLVFFALSAITILDNLLNGETSWAYDNDNVDILFRSVNGDGNIPMFGIDEKVDADQIFRNSLKQRKQKPE